MIPAFLGIDIGTSGIRGCCIDENGIELASISVSLPSVISDAGKREQAPEIWWQTTKEIIGSITSSLNNTEIKAIAIDGTSGTVLLTDADGIPLSPALMYNDQRCMAEAGQIAHIAPADSASHGASAGLAKLLHLSRQFPNARYLCHQADWLSSNLTGNFGISDENNCLKTGYDPVTRSWPSFIQKLGIPATLLPKVVAPGMPTGMIQNSIALSLGLSTSCEVIAGTTDSIAAFIATGASEVGTGVTSLGSTLSLKMITAKPVFSSGDGIYSHRLNDAWLVGGASNSGGRVLLKYFTQQQIDKLSSSLDAGKATGLDYYPLPEKGERFPINDADMESCITPKPDDDLTFFQALLEGITHIEKTGYEKLQALSTTGLSKIITSGGGSTNTGWTKIRHNIIGVPVSQSEHAEASYGSALLARQGYRKKQ